MLQATIASRYPSRLWGAEPWRAGNRAVKGALRIGRLECHYTKMNGYALGK
jgi:hypothetical protein